MVSDFRCVDACREKGSMVPEEQAARHCCLPGVNVSKWSGEKLFRIHMGAPPRYSREGIDLDWAKPDIDQEHNGCPAGWWRSPFVESVLAYYRPYDQQSNRIANKLLDANTDPLVWEAVSALESAQDEAASIYAENCRKKNKG